MRVRFTPKTALSALAACTGLVLSAGAIAAPGNNDCGVNSAGYTISPTGGTGSDTLAGATRDGAACTSPTTGVDAYWYFKPATAGPWRIQTCGSTPSFDTVVSIHTNSCPVSASNYATGSSSSSCNDDGCAPLSVISSVTLVADTSYIIRVASYSSSSTPGPYILTVSNLAIPGACCSQDGSCNVEPASSCTSPRTFNGSASCTPNPCPQPPAGDFCANPLPLTIATPYSTNNSSFLSLNDGVAPTCQSSVSKGVWFTLSTGPTQAGSYTISTCGGPDHDTVLSIFNAGVTCSGIDTVANIKACNDDAGPVCTGTRASLLTELAASSTYLIRVQSYGSSASGGAITLSVDLAPTIACCDDTTGACTPVLASIGCASGSSHIGDACTPSPCPPAAACCGAGGICTLVTESACTGGGGSWQGTPFVCTPTNPCPQDPSSNDNCVTSNLAINFTIPGAGGTVSGDASTATNDGTGCGATTGKDLYYLFSPSTSGSWMLSLCSSATSWDSVLSIHTGCPTSTANLVATTGACNDTGCPTGGHGQLNAVELVSGTQYVIRVAGYSSSSTPSGFELVVSPVITGACCYPDGHCTPGVGSCTGGATYSGDNTVCTPNDCAQPTRPANDSCGPTNPELLIATAYSDNNTFALTDLNQATPCPGVLGNAANGSDVFYRFTAPATANYTLNTCGSSLDTVLSVHSACPATNANLLACNDDSGYPTGNVACSATLNSRIQTVLLTAGTLYTVRVAGYNSNQGTFTVIVDYVNAAAIGACCNGSTCTLTEGVSNCTGGGVFQGPGTVCSPSPCAAPPAGTCCRGSTCNTGVAQASCTSPAAGIGATYATGPLGNACNVLNNRAAPCCYADFNKSAGVTAQDIFDFLAAWFAGSPYARYGGDGTGGAPTAQSIFDFLAAWFLGPCPAYGP